MSLPVKATWANGKRTVTGWWSYHRPSDSFRITLDSVDRITGANRRIITTNDTPEWGNWKLVKEQKP